jgi:hypothetical protein
MKGIRKHIFTIVLLTTPFMVMAQDVEDILNEKVVVENPVYKPVIAIGSGVFNFYGDVKNNFSNPVIGDYAYKVNISTFIDQKRYYKANFFFIYGQLSADQRSLTDTAQNLNFRSDLVDVGVNLEYRFGHLFKKFNAIRPFISLGIENIQFTPKGDLKYRDLSTGEVKNYNYWSDGTIRDLPQADLSSNSASLMHRDFVFETDLRQLEVEKGNKKYSQNAFSLPIDAGLDFRISDRVTCRLGTSIHLTNTDFLDNVSSKGTSVIGKKGNDYFTFSYFSLHFDLFSQPKIMIVEKMFAEMEVNDVMFDDEDGDFIMDAVDNCPGTPYGVVVDTLGCPLDRDNDGVPDYLDLEPGSRPGVWVDAEGKTISEDVFLESLLKSSDALRRAEVKAYFETVGKGYVRKRITEIPEKFKKLDINSDGYIDFEELLKAIDNFFDGKFDFKVEDIYELNNFFFEQ